MTCFAASNSQNQGNQNNMFVEVDGFTTPKSKIAQFGVCFSACFSGQAKVATGSIDAIHRL